MRAANHHGRGTAKHFTRVRYDAPHTDVTRAGLNRYWTWCGGIVKGSPDGCPRMESDERNYYGERFAVGVAAQNERNRARRQYGRLRTVEQVYENRMTQPEESLLYIGDKEHLGEVSPDVLWSCVVEYVRWEMDYSKRHGEFYRPLSLALNADERGQLHVHERGVYQYKDADGYWRVGQAAALKAAGFPLPDPSAPRDTDNNRKMVWDAARREKWLDIVEAHGFQVEREPEAQRPHMGLEAWQAWQDAMADAQTAQEQAQADAEGIRATARQEASEAVQKAQEKAQGLLDAAGRATVAQKAISDAVGVGLIRRHKREAEDRREQDAAIREREADLKRREAELAAKLEAFDVVQQERVQRLARGKLRQQEERSRGRVQDGDALLAGMPGHSPGVPGHGPQGREG